MADHRYDGPSLSNPGVWVRHRLWRTQTPGLHGLLRISHIIKPSRLDCACKLTLPQKRDKHRLIFLTSCAGGRHNTPRPLQLDLRPFDIYSGVRVTCDVGTSVPFSLHRPLCSQLRLDVRDRQTDVRRASSLNASVLWGRGHNNIG